ncbi:MAG: nucleotidyltransferase substrate binding protein [bacterium]|nr:nucleotidyltransferase substrate binding protein [bacterium]
MITKDIRFEQRFQNFEKAHHVLEQSLLIQSPSEVERGGIIQFFELAFELSWKIMKDYLETQGFIANSPREALKQAFQAGVIQDGHRWIDALEKRNLSTHIYDEEVALGILQDIRQYYFPLIDQLYKYFQNLK